MKKLLLVGLATLSLSLPAFAQFSVTGVVEASYSQSIGQGLSWGITGGVSVPVIPSFGLNLYATPYIKYSTELVKNDMLTVTGYGRVNLPLNFAITPTSSFSVAITPKAGIDLSYKINESLELLSRLELALPFNLAPSAGFGGVSLGIPYIELDYYMGALTLYGGTGFSFLPGFSWGGLYAGALYDLSSNLSIQGELSSAFQGSFDLTLKLNIKP